jgi:putative ABC transport system ATP-binding protein
MNDVLVHARGLRKDCGSGEGLVRALDTVDLDVNRGEAVAVMGPSGRGKSTLLHLIGGLDRPSAGQLSIAGQRVDELSERALAYLRRDEIGFVFQSFQLMDELTAQENAELPALIAVPRGTSAPSRSGSKPREPAATRAPRRPGEGARPAALSPGPARHPAPWRPGSAGRRHPAGRTA